MMFNLPNPVVAPIPSHRLTMRSWTAALCTLLLTCQALAQESEKTSQPETTSPPAERASAEQDPSAEETPRTNAFNLTRSVGSDRRPAFSPDDRQIVFESRRDGNWELYLMDRDGWNQKRLTVHPADDRSASFSPDGKQLVFQSNRLSEGRAADIFLLSLTEAAPPWRLTDHEADDAFPRFSPDGTKIVFTSIRDGAADIFLMNTDGSELQRLTEDPANDVWPSFSGDGRKIAFFSQRDGNDELYMMNMDGSDQQRLTDHPASDLVPMFDPTHNRIVFASNRRGETTQLYFLEPGKEEIQLGIRTKGRTTEPAFSSDGRFLAFVTNLDGQDEVYLLDLEREGDSLRLESGDSPSQTPKPSQSPR